VQSKRFIFQLAISICALSVVASTKFATACGDAGAPRSAAATTNPRKPQEGFNKIEALANLGEIKIVIAEIDAFFNPAGLNKDAVKKIMVDELANTKVTICSESADCCAKGSGKSCEPANVPILYLKLNSLPPSGTNGEPAFTMNLALVEKVKLARSGVESMVPVWSITRPGVLAQNNHNNFDRQLKDAMADFRNDLALANN